MQVTTHSAALGSRIASLRRQRRMSQRFLADVLGVDYHTLGKYEAGTVKVRRSMLIAIATALAVTPEELDPHYLS